MQAYKARATIILTRGIVHLSAYQAMARRLDLHRIGDDLYKIVREIQFEKGEVFGHDAVLKGAAVELVSDQTEVTPGAQAAAGIMTMGARIAQPNG